MKQKISVTVFSLTLLMTTAAVHAADKNQRTSPPLLVETSGSSSLAQSFINIDKKSIETKEDEEEIEGVPVDLSEKLDALGTDLKEHITNEVAKLKTDSNQQEKAIKQKYKAQVQKIENESAEALKTAEERGRRAYIAELPAAFIANGLEESITNKQFTTQTNPNPQRNVIETLERTAAYLATPVDNPGTTRELGSIDSSSSSNSTSLRASSAPTQKSTTKTVHFASKTPKSVRKLSTTSAQMVEATITSLQALKDANPESFKKTEEKKSVEQTSSKETSVNKPTTAGWGTTVYSAFSNALNSGVSRVRNSSVGKKGKNSQS
jgi:hypothetical protein